MKDKKFYPMGSKSTNFDALKAGKKPIAKESSPLRVSLDKNKLFASNDFDADRKYLMNKVMSINGKRPTDSASKSKIGNTGGKSAIQQILNPKESFVKTGFSGINKSNALSQANISGGLRSISQKTKTDDEKYKMPNINSHLYNVNASPKQNIPNSTKEIMNSLNQQKISPLKQSAKFVMNSTSEKRPNPSTVNNRNAFLQQLKKDDSSPKQRYKDAINIKENSPSGNSGANITGNTNYNSNAQSNSPIINSINTLQSSTSMNSNSNSPNSLVNLKEAIKMQKNEPQKVVLGNSSANNSGNNNAAHNLHANPNTNPNTNNNTNPNNNNNNNNNNSNYGISSSSGNINNQNSVPNSTNNVVSKSKNSPENKKKKDVKRGTLAETDALAEMFREKFKNLEAGQNEDDSSDQSMSSDNERESPKNTKKTKKHNEPEITNPLILREKEKEKNKHKNSNDSESPLQGCMIKTNYSKSVAGANEDKTRKTNQDSYICKTNLLNMKNFSLFSVFDGHGQHGHFISGFMRTNLYNFFSSKDLYKDLFAKNEEVKESDIYQKLKANNWEIIRKSYLKLDNELRTTKFETDLSGTTAVSLILIGNKIISFNLGDSRAIMAQEKKSSLKEHCVPVQLSRDQKPDLPEEKERIIRSGGQVNKLGDDDDDIGPYRVWVKGENYPGLAMSRSIGDFAAKSVGVISDPEILEFELTSDIKFIVLASDGVWEFLSNKQVVDIVNRYYKSGEIQKAADKLVEEATRYWKEEDEIIDDITVVIVFF